MLGAFSSKGSINGERICPALARRPFAGGGVISFEQGVVGSNADVSTAASAKLKLAAPISGAGAADASLKAIQHPACVVGAEGQIQAQTKMRFYAVSAFLSLGNIVGNAHRRATATAVALLSGKALAGLWWKRRYLIPPSRTMCVPSEPRAAMQSPEVRSIVVQADPPQPATSVQQ